MGVISKSAFVLLIRAYFGARDFGAGIFLIGWNFPGYNYMTDVSTELPFVARKSTILTQIAGAPAIVSHKKLRALTTTQNLNLKRNVKSSRVAL